MGKTKKPKKKRPGSTSPPAARGSSSPASISLIKKQQSGLGFSVGEAAAQDASVLVHMTDSAIRKPLVATSPDLGQNRDDLSDGKQQSTIGSPASVTPTKNASVPVQETSSAINVTTATGLINADKSTQNSTVSVPEITEFAGKASVEAITSNPLPAEAVLAVDPVVSTSPATASDWVGLFKGSSRTLSRKGTAFVLPSGETCVKIPNSVIEKNQKSWESFIIGQFYADPPPQALVHTIVNGIWSRHFKDISVSKMEGNAYLFRIPNVQTRRRVLNQRLWKIDGQTMFVADWAPGVIPVKPELSSAPIWLELRNVPFQFFNEEGLEHIAGLVGDPKCLHPDTANKSNLEVAKVFTIIDPRKPLPEAVNVMFDSGTIIRVGVCSPWMPPVCSHCKEIGHSLKRCKSAPITCKGCNSTSHIVDKCPRIKGNGVRLPSRVKGKAVAYKCEDESRSLSQAVLSKQSTPKGDVCVVEDKPKATLEVVDPLSRLSVLVVGEASNPTVLSQEIVSEHGASGQVSTKVSEADSDSSDVNSSEDSASDFVSEEEHEYLESKVSKFVNALLPGWCFEDNYDFSDLGKIWILWHPSIKVMILSKSLQMITCKVLFPDNPSSFIISFVYASNDPATRSTLWNEITTLSDDSRVAGRPWAVIGDFNQTLNPSDHSAPPSLNLDRQTREFSASIQHASLIDLTFRGCSFTWWNKRRVNPVAKKLDRILVNDEWQSSFPLSFGFFGAPEFSDHSPSCITLSYAQPRSKKPFRFFNYLQKSPDFLPLICSSWFSINVVGSDMFRVSYKLRALKKVIRDFSRENFSDLEKRVKDALVVLSELQCRMLSDPSPSNAALELEATRKWEILVRAEEAFFCQKSRITWLSEGDLNTAYFHKMASTRQAINHIHFLLDGDGTRIESQQGIQNLCVGFFKDLLGSDETQPLFAHEDISSLLNFQCNADQVRSFEAEFTKEEIKAAFFSLPKNKASGPDGYPVEFFTNSWSVVGAEVISAVSEFFTSGKLLKQWNATTLVLIPKVQNATKVSDFRPISCLNTVYKVISKLLASRLQSFLPSVISHSQSAFLSGRLLSENVLLASEIVQGYNRSNITARAMLKVDLRKAFDSVRWDFIFSVLAALGLPNKFMGWIKECVCTPCFSISLNGHSDGFFKSTRGLRQGDPLSPYLFVLAMEVFSKLLQSRFQSGYINYHPKTVDLDISHLMFADDVMVFFDGSSSSLHGIYETLDDFAGWSGLNMNRDKTLLFCAGLSPNETSAITSYGFPSASLPVRYLGLPLMSRKLRVNEYSPLLDKISYKFRAWAVKSLSFAGRAQLIASVIYGTINFWMSTFVLPKGCIKKIESMCSSFLWSGSLENHNKAKVAWSTVCLPKNEGGLGLRKLSVWNTTLSLKLIWLLFSNSGSLWVAWQRHHHKLDMNCFWAINAKNTDSWLWKNLLKLRHLAEKFIRCTIGSGSKAWFWYDNWSPMGPLLKLLGDSGPINLRIPLNARVANACHDEGWLLAHSRSDHALSLQLYLSTIPLPSASTDDDSFGWVVEDKLCEGFSASKTWEVLRPRDSVKAWANLIWFKGSTPRHAFNMWIANLDRLPTLSRLASWGLQVTTCCCLCSTAVETRSHLFIDCSFTKVIWERVFLRLGLPTIWFTTWDSMLAWTRITLPPLIIFKDIDRQLINSINARRCLKKFRNLMPLWLK
ncbi:Endonuclease/exonuclease/phosphatase superfamily [Arabidopsis thaliana x Arabidopsis arenosa]|uniref:Endonuclease/exonuclease/phosphatase superfamily n=1 Tax=Arabidopsis thaliana x Arabidopsis arenosa TaxID=1240361 RepID=A0A8T1Z1R7_9BRAS|nr:Endonuclease/exonuclease/phosphatase superfamily [Arabidopsis thaliana x Arabidopsis arenosa]